MNHFMCVAANVTLKCKLADEITATFIAKSSAESGPKALAKELPK